MEIYRDMCVYVYIYDCVCVFLPPPLEPNHTKTTPQQIDPDSLINHAGERREREQLLPGADNDDEAEAAAAKGDALEKRRRWVWVCFVWFGLLDWLVGWLAADQQGASQ